MSHLRTPKPATPLPKLGPYTPTPYIPNPALALRYRPPVNTLNPINLRHMDPQGTDGMLSRRSCGRFRAGLQSPIQEFKGLGV